MVKVEKQQGLDIQVERIQVGIHDRVFSAVRNTLVTLTLLATLGGIAQSEAASIPSSSSTVAPLQDSVVTSARIDPATFTVGDPVRYILTVTHPAGTRADLPDVRKNTGALEVLAYQVHRDSTSSGQRVDTCTLTLAAYSVGHDTLPPQRVEIRPLSTSVDTAARLFYTTATPLFVRATAPANAKDIADIQDTERLSGVVPWGLPILFVLIGLLILLYRKWKKWKAKRDARPAPLPAALVVSPEDTALAHLRALEEAGLIGSSNPEGPRLFAFRLSEIVREYLAARFGIDALEATTSELLTRSAPLPLLPEQHVWIGEASVELDIVKFATGVLSAADAMRLLEGTRCFVRSTPQPNPSTPDSPAALSERNVAE